tara:strand:- start:140 stop:343 length:204 start_codon:yes stop_codon:yes gene_type:complete
MIIRRQSIITSNINSMNIAVTEEQIKKWQEGMMIQDAMPDLTANEREFLINGVTPDEWKKYMGAEDE